MTSHVIQFLAIVGLLCVLQISIDAAGVEHEGSWGDLSDGRAVFYRDKSKVAIPFVKRETDVAFPEDFYVDDELVDAAVIRGIKHVETTDGACQPTAEITEGGIGQNSATVKLTSPSGCGIHSKISFYVQLPQLLKKDVKN